MNSNDARENNNDKAYINILLKIKHKPVILKYILSFAIKSPYKFIYLIESDKVLKTEINSFFKTAKIKNNLSNDLRNNLFFLTAYKKFKNNYETIETEFYEKLVERQYSVFEEIDPSISTNLSKYMLNLLEIEMNKNIKNTILPSVAGLEELIFNQNFKLRKLVCLPKMNKTTKIFYGDSIYFEKYLLKNLDKEEIEVLYCIIDDNQYFNNIMPEYKKIKIKKIHFIFIKGNKIIDLYYSIKKFLNNINTDYLEEIFFGKGFLELKQYNGNYYYDMPLLNENTFKKKWEIKINNSTKINFDSNPNNIRCCKYNKNLLKINLGLYLGLSLLFTNVNINGVKIIDSKKYYKEKFERKKKYSENILLIKIHDLLFFENKHFMNTLNDLVEQFKYIIIYMNLSDKSNNKESLKKIDISSFIKRKGDFLFYTETPLNNIILPKIVDDLIQIKDKNNNLILLYKECWYYKYSLYLSFLWYKYTTIKFYNEELIFIHNENNILFYNMKYMGLHEINKASLEKIDSIYFVNCFDYLNDDDDIYKKIKKIYVLSNGKKPENFKNKIANIDVKFVVTDFDLIENSNQIFDFINKHKHKKNKNKNNKKIKFNYEENMNEMNEIQEYEIKDITDTEEEEDENENDLL